MSKEDAIWLMVVYLLALTFCGDPDLQDAVIERVSPSTAAQDSREG